MGGGRGHAPVVPSLTAASKVVGRGSDSPAGHRRASLREWREHNGNLGFPRCRPPFIPGGFVGTHQDR
jgi:hypothetical protein